jgi:hypothetical protein
MLRHKPCSWLANSNFENWAQEILCRRLNKERGIVSSRVTLLLRSAEIKPWCRICDECYDVTDKSTGLPIFKEFVWFVYKVSCVMCSTSTSEDCWSIEGWIHSKRKNKIHKKLVEKLVHTHTNLTMGHRVYHR